MLDLPTLPEHILRFFVEDIPKEFALYMVSRVCKARYNERRNTFHPTKLTTFMSSVDLALRIFTTHVSYSIHDKLSDVILKKGKVVIDSRTEIVFPMLRLTRLKDKLEVGGVKIVECKICGSSDPTKLISSFCCDDHIDVLLGCDCVVCGDCFRQWFEFISGSFSTDDQKYWIVPRQNMNKELCLDAGSMVKVHCPCRTCQVVIDDLIRYACRTLYSMHKIHTKCIFLPESSPFRRVQSSIRMLEPSECEKLRWIANYKLYHDLGFSHCVQPNCSGYCVPFNENIFLIGKNGNELIENAVQQVQDKKYVGNMDKNNGCFIKVHEGYKFVPPNVSQHKTTYLNHQGYFVSKSEYVLKDDNNLSSITHLSACMRCSRLQCIQCMKPIHAGDCCSREKEDWKTTMKDSKRCPHCLIVCHRIDGCDHVQCWHCKNKFCFHCKSYDKTKFNRQKNKFEEQQYVCGSSCQKAEFKDNITVPTMVPSMVKGIINDIINEI